MSKMKANLCLFLLFVIFIQNTAFSQHNNAAKLDGVDNVFSIGMDTLCNVWTLEAWIKGDGNKWNEIEAIIAGNSIGRRNPPDYFPLIIKDGKLYNNGANISSSETLPTNEWIHVAAVSNNKNTSLYINGNLVASKDTSTIILPYAIGAGNKDSAFGGNIDEVRIWQTSLSSKELKNWMNKPISSSHPKFDKLYGYYNFDELSEDMSINRVGKGYKNYHIRNGRVEHYGELPLAYLVENDNSKFKNYEGEQRLFNATVIASEWDSDQGEKDDQILKIRVIVEGQSKPLCLDKITLDLSNCSDLNDISQLNLYYTGSNPRYNIKEAICEPIKKIKNKLEIKVEKELESGVNYFLLSADISSKAKIGDKLKITVPEISLSGKKVTPTPDDISLDKFISVNSKQDKNIYKVIQWNIWHGGVHVGGKAGRLRIIDLIKDSNSDLVMMQEAYGSQEQIADSLSFEMLSASNKDNLALFSRYPLEKIKTENPFFSNPAFVTLPTGRKILLDNIWIRYASYNGNYISAGLDTKQWSKQDSTLGLKDIQRNIINDVNPYYESGMDVIIGGDFNSGSHLDWTKRAAHLHNGYAAEDLPVSRYMYEQGYIDTFRFLNPDEVSRPEGTFAPIYGHRQYSRIDYIYSKGDGIKPIFSRIIRTPYEIDDVWAGDHAAVLTIFNLF